MFQYQLASALGYTRKDLLSSMPASEYSYWKAFYTIYPMPQERADMRAGTTLQGIFAGPQKKRWSLSQCTLNFIGKAADQTEAQMKSIFRLATKNLPVIKMRRPKKPRENKQWP